MTRFLKLLPLMFMLCGCAAQTRSLLDAPALTPVGKGYDDDLTTASVASAFEQKNAEDQDSFWVGGKADFFRDLRPRSKGDMITVNISVNDSAIFNNSSARSRKAANSASTEFDLGLFNLMTQGQGEAHINGNTLSSGQGSIVRSEKLKMKLTAVVKEVLPNGYFVIDGSQQVLVNSEMRDVRVAGIVNPSDIAPDNSIDYHKIAEARAQYGGAGIVTTVQKPALGTQLWDKLMPF
jgi:flagellar L-ring protein FlgH